MSIDRRPVSRRPSTSGLATAPLPTATILLLDGDPESGLCSALFSLLRSTSGINVLRVNWRGCCEADWHEEEFRGRIPASQPDLIGLVLPSDRLAAAEQPIRALRGFDPSTPVLCAVQCCDPDQVMHLFALGIADFVTPPLTPLGIVPRIQRLLEQSKTVGAPLSAVKLAAGLRQMVGRSPNFLVETAKIPVVVRCDASMLILGETGTGKELFARAVHYLSPRAGKPFVPLNCGAVPVDLIENELFGHVPGAYTSAEALQVGVIHESDGGTLFLDEIDSLPLAAQVKLLRFLQEKEYRPLGGGGPRQADVRVIASTNADVRLAVRDGKIRMDLYYRLNVVSISLPPLRERPEDIPLLAAHFLKKYAAEFGRAVPQLTSGALRKLLLHGWPGNIRELEHVIQRAVAFTPGEQIDVDEILFPLSPTGAAEPVSFREAKARVVEEFERSYLRGLLAATGGNITRAAAVSRKHRRAFWALLRKHRIDAGAFRSEPYDHGTMPVQR